MSQGGGAAEVGAEARLPAPDVGGISTGAELEQDFVTDETQQAFAGGREQDWVGSLHLKKVLPRNRGPKSAKSAVLRVDLAGRTF